MRRTSSEQSQARDDALERGRASFGSKAWADAFSQLSFADAAEPLGLDDLERLAFSARLLARDAESEALLERVHHEALREREIVRAARSAFWLGMSLMTRGELGQGGGWFARGRRLLDDEDFDVAERGYFLVPVALQALFGGDIVTAHETFGLAEATALRFHDPDLTAMARLGRGQALIRLARPKEGIALLDDAMVGVLADEVSPTIAGIVYCGVIDACQSLFDVRRAGEWSEALTSWCASQPDLVPFHGQCLVHRAEMMRLRGDWSDALDEVERAASVTPRVRGQAVLAAAAYQKAELHRLRGETTDAESAYRRASDLGRDPQPGLALLRLAQGQAGDAAATIRRVVDSTHEHIPRAALLAAYVEILLAVDDVDAASAGAAELAGVAAELDAPFLHATAAHSSGAILLARGDTRGALVELRRAATAWRDVDAPYETARTRVLIGLACGLVGDRDTAALEMDAARHTFDRLGAVPDLQRLDELAGAGERPATGGLTGREVEVLQLVATGRTNRDIADALVISEKTVARHVANIFVKLGVSSRTAATAYAYRRGLA